MVEIHRLYPVASVVRVERPANMEMAEDLEGIFGGVRFSRMAGAARAEAVRVSGRKKVEKCIFDDNL